MTTNIEDIPTPDGWERLGPCFIRENGGKLAFLHYYPRSGLVHVELRKPDGCYSPGWDTLDNAIAWANEQLGIPKPVEIVEREFADGSRTFASSDGKRSAYVYPYFTSFRCLYGTREFMSRDHHEVVEIARKYVRGEA